jgi:agmatine deiminase
MTNQRLPAEWEPQDAILLFWPHKETQWQSTLKEITQLYEALVSVICDYADVVIALPEDQIKTVKVGLEAMTVPLEHVYFYPVYGKNIWARDCGLAVVETETHFKLLNFVGNNQISKQLCDLGVFASTECETWDWVLGLGSFETDGQGTFLCTHATLTNIIKSTHLSELEIEARFKSLFGASNICWLEHGYLMGDETAGHIDSLARFCPNDVLIYTACDDEQDEHYDALKQMEAELSHLRNTKGAPYRLMPLPWPSKLVDDSDERLPASYTHFVVVNEAVLVPIFNLLSDEDALEAISSAFPGYEIMGIPSEILLERRGHLHRITMPLPAGVLSLLNE